MILRPECQRIAIDVAALEREELRGAQSCAAYISHHNEHPRLEQRPPLFKPPPAERPLPNKIGRRDLLGGLIREYYPIAA